MGNNDVKGTYDKSNTVNVKDESAQIAPADAIESQENELHPVFQQQAAQKSSFATLNETASPSTVAAPSTNIIAHRCVLTLLVIAGGGHHPLAIAFGSHFNLDGANWL